MDDDEYMREAIAEAEAAAALGEVPVGAIVVVDGAIVGRGGNRRESAGDPTAHAELLAIREAARAVGGWRLVGATLFVTQEPCPMCAGAIVNARVERVVFGCDNPKAGAVKTLYRLLEDPRLNHRVLVEQSRAGEGVRRAADEVLRRIATIVSHGEVAESGRLRLIRNQVYPQGYRGFESLPLRRAPCALVPIGIGTVLL